MKQNKPSISDLLVQKKLLCLGVLISFLAGTVQPLISIAIGRLFDIFSDFTKATIDGSILIQKSLLIVYGLIAIGVAKWFFKGCMLWKWMQYGELVAQSQRNSLFESLLGKEMNWFDSCSDGLEPLLVRFKTQIQDFQLANSQPLGFICTSTTEMLFSLTIAFYNNWKLTLINLAGIAIITTALSITGMKMSKAMKEHEKALIGATRIAKNAITNIIMVKCSNAQQHEKLRYSKEINSAAFCYRNQAHFVALQIGLMRFMLPALIIAGLYYGSSTIHNNETTSGKVITTFWSCLTASQALEDLLPHLVVVQKGFAAIQTLHSSLQSSRSLDDVFKSCQNLTPSILDGDLEIRNVFFSYPSLPEKYVLRNCNMFFPAGEVTVVIGRSGSGKSTLGNLLMKFYQPNTGDVYVDGRNLQDLNTNWIRNNITLAHQQSNLFNETLRTNLILGSHQYSIPQGSLNDCLASTCLTQTISSFPQKLNTPVGTGGLQLSGGQRQRVAIARAILRDTRVLILDECTSALDHNTARIVMQNLRRVRRGKTTIIITHDTSLLQEDDFIYMLENGKIRAQGHLQSMRKHLGADKRWISHSSTQLNRDRGASNLIKSSKIWTRSMNVHKSWFVHPISINQSQRLSDQIVSSKKRHIMQPPDSQPRPTSSEKIVCDSQSDLKLENDQLLKPVDIISTLWQNTDSYHRILLIVGFLCATLHAANPSVASYVIVKMVSSFYLEKNWQSQLQTYAVSFVGIAALDAVATYLMHYLLETAAQFWVDQLRNKAMNNIIDQPKAWFDSETNSSTPLCSILDQDADNMRHLIGRFAALWLVIIVVSLISAIWSLIICWKLALAGIAGVPFVYLLDHTFETISSRWDIRTHEANDVIYDIFNETFSNIKTVRSLTLESYFHKKFVDANVSACAIGKRRAFYTGIIYGASDGIFTCIIAAVFGYGAYLAQTSEYSVNSILTVFGLLLFGITSATSVFAYIPQVSSSMGSATRLIHLVRMEVTSHENAGSSEFDPNFSNSLEAVEFTDQSFCYPTRPDTLALSGFNIKITAGGCTAIVGSSGSGKSTIASLILKLYNSGEDYTSKILKTPSLRIFGNDIHSLETRSLRNCMAFAPQTPVLLPLTIRENILYGDLSNSLKTESNLRASAEQAGIHEFIMTLPQDYNTVIGDGGLSLSGGQAQRIAIARALARRPTLLVLDEPTSALDSRNTDILLRNIREIIKRQNGLTVLVVTHSAAVMKWADQVAVLDQGRLIGKGAYSRLILAKGKLWELVES